jgi:hypothetical protein
LDEGSIGELLDTISGALERDLKVCIGGSLANANTPNGVKEQVRRVILVGASNLKKAGFFFSRFGLEVTDLCVPGWVISPVNVTEMASQLGNLNIGPSDAVVIDLFGNSVYRFIDYDGTISRPYKQGGTYHMAGKVTVCEDEIFRNLVDLAQPVLEATAGHLVVVMPPPPGTCSTGVAACPTTVKMLMMWGMLRNCWVMCCT